MRAIECLAALLMLVTAGCLGMLPPGGDAAASSPTAIVNENAERALVDANGGAGRLLVLAAPSSSFATATTTTITVHGINAAPETMQPIHERARREGHGVLTYVYDDQHRRLTQSARELGRELRALDGRGRLEIVGHSMGARLAVAALALDEGVGHFESVTLQLIAPALAGFAAADGVGLTPLPLAWIGGLRPAQDLGPSSTFQETINGYRPAPNVAVSIFVGSADKIVDPRSDRLRAIAKHLHANVVIVDSEDHDSIVRFVARMSSGPVARND